SLAPKLDDKLADPTPLPGRGLSLPPSVVVGVTPHAGMQIVENRAMWHQFKAMQVPTEDSDSRFADIDKGKMPNEESKLVEGLATLAELASRDGRTHVLAAVCVGMVKRETNGASEGRRQACTMALRRLLRPALLRGIAQLLPRKREIAADLEAVLARAGAEGADAVIELLAEESLATDRHVYLDILPRLQTGVPTLVHMLGDTRWFVVRNATDLLGEMKVQSAEPERRLLERKPNSFRIAAIQALAESRTPAALAAIAVLREDKERDVREAAARAYQHATRGA